MSPKKLFRLLSTGFFSLIISTITIRTLIHVLHELKYCVFIGMLAIFIIALMWFRYTKSSPYMETFWFYLSNLVLLAEGIFLTIILIKEPFSYPANLSYIICSLGFISISLSETLNWERI